ncbi:cobalt-zinc-cadmium resistance protein CzcA [Nonlabens ulvanivorans]|uniref:Cobalt-zinc-cadmium resistance protein CzcA n=1 Tax=Nonlabens ulvanivorans TaxID=906888 RepID=A0A090QIH0_NONUL|nr:efflux RND transporter permease subunit [Nonlabens ulvanivorans]GAL02013.1 cobalt-zinc-cadmium resistance protein CzcA [Nonlabens ulvanivorans]
MATKKKSDKEFKLSSWAIDNSTVVYVMMAIIFFLGLSAYNNMPREDFPEIKETKIYISSVWPGNTAEDVERLITDPLEDKLKNISGVTETESTSQEDYSIIIVEFDEDIEVETAKQLVKDEVDSESAGEDWPTFNNKPVTPNVFNLTLSEEMPIMNINIKGDYTVRKLKTYAEYLEDEIEDIEQIKQVDIRGAQDLEVEIAVDIYKMTAAQISFDDILNTVRGGNATVSAGNLKSSGQRRTIRIVGEISNPKELENFVIKNDNGPIYIRDVATITFKEEDKNTFAREYGDQVVMLDVKKRSGKNMIVAADAIRSIVTESQESGALPADLDITIANDLSSKTLNQVDDLVNNIIFGILLVVGVLMFFLGFRNALFVGFAIPMSMFMSFAIISFFGYTLNTMILFAMIMGLGMLVDNGIVVVENVYRLMDEEGMSRIEAAKKGVGEIAIPIIISTLTTVAAFVPLGLWPGLMGAIHDLFPYNFIYSLGSSLFVAIFFNSMLVSKFMEIEDRNLSVKQLLYLTAIMGTLGIFILIVGGPVRGLGSVMVLTVILFWLYKYLIKPLTRGFQKTFLAWLDKVYENFLKFALSGIKPYLFIGGMFIMFVAVLMAFGSSIGSGRTKIEFFPDNKPNQIIVYVEYPQGTAIEKTNQITKEIESRVFEIINAEEYMEGDRNFLVESAVSQVGMGAGNPQTDGGSAAEMPHKGKITASMREYKFRNGKDSEVLRKKVQEALAGVYPGVSISVEKDAAGPPQGYPVNIELEGNDYGELIVTAEQMVKFLNARNVAGVDQLKVDVNRSKPSMLVSVDREKAGELGVSNSQVGMQLRRAVFGEKAGIYKNEGEDYDINIRFNEEQRYDRSAIFNQRITFRDMATGQIKEVPVSAIAQQKNTSSFSAIKHKDAKRVVTVYSALKPGFTDAGAVVADIQNEMLDFETPKDIKIDYTGQIEEQNKEMAFLMSALFGGLFLIFLILIFQFGSISKPTIIMVAIFLSFIGVFLGLIVTGDSFVILMTMMGIISLAGIVVNNGVVLIDYIDILKLRRREQLDLEDDDIIGKEDMFNAIVKGGKARLRPVILTAITTVLGLIPLAIGLNINFFTLFSEFDPKIFVGGDNVIFWGGPLAWTVIYGLIFATFLTLVIVPVLLYMVHRVKLRWRRFRSPKTVKVEEHIEAA